MGREVSNRADGLRFKLAPGLDSRPAHTPQVLVGGEIRLKSVQHMENVQVQFGRGKKNPQLTSGQFDVYTSRNVYIP